MIVDEYERTREIKISQLSTISAMAAISGR